MPATVTRCKRRPPIRNRAVLIDPAAHALWLLADRPALEPHASEN